MKFTITFYEDGRFSFVSTFVQEMRLSTKEGNPAGTSAIHHRSSLHGNCHVDGELIYVSFAPDPKDYDEEVAIANLGYDKLKKRSFMTFAFKDGALVNRGLQSKRFLYLKKVCLSGQNCIQ